MTSTSILTDALASPLGIGYAREQRRFPRRPERNLPVRLLHWSCLIFCALSLVTVPRAWSQQQATVSGIITDPSGAVIPSATVHVANIATQVIIIAVTNSTGYYVAGNLVPGMYTITVKKVGFMTATRSAFALQVGQSATVDFKLQVGQVSQMVFVKATPPLLATTNATVGQVIGPREMVELPLNGRNYFSLAELAPGVSTYGLRSSFSHAINDYGASFNSGSGGEDRNGFTLDGANIKAYKTNQSYVPSVDAIQEFRIETSPYSADLGNSPGAQILLVTKSGTDEFHGDAYEFIRNDLFNAHNYFDNPRIPIPELNKNQFGATLGGPIIKDKLFFFVSYEGQRERIGETFFGTVPTVQMRNGDFSQIQQTIYNPFTTQPCSTCPSGVSRVAFANNLIPPSLISAVSTKFTQAQFPLPTGSGIANNFAGSSVDRNTRNQTNIRIDYDKPKDAIFGRYSFNNSNLYAAKQTFGGGQLPGFGDNDVFTFSNITVADVHTINPTTVFKAQVSYLRLWYNLLPEQLGNSLNSELGVQGVLPNEPFITNIAGMSNPGSDPYDPEYRAANQYSYEGKLTKVWGKHTLEMGGEYDRRQVLMDASPAFPQGQFSFNGSFTKNPNAPSSVITGFPFADFLLGYPVNAQSNTGDTGGAMFNNDWQWWFNDAFRATPNLTLNLGVRWEYDGPFYEKFNRLSNFDPASGKLIIAGQDFVTRSANVRPYYRNYAPRFGFAYSIPGHRSTVFRGGYGIFYDTVQENAVEATRNNPPFSNFPQFLAGNTTKGVPSVPIQDVFSPSSATPAASAMEAIDMNLYGGYQQQASFGIQHQFGTSIVAEANYNWQKNTGFPATRNLNAPTKNGTFILPYPQFSAIDYFTNLEYGNYNGLLMSLEKRFSHGLTFLTSFTWSKYLDNITSGDAEGAPGDPGFQNPYCFSCDYGPSASDFEKRVVQSWVYDLPSLGGHRPLVRNLIGGWELSGILTYQSGFPVTPRVSFDNSESETFADRPNVVLGVPFFPPGTQNPSRWFNPAAFVVAPAGQFGNAGKGIILGPNLIDLDPAVMKNFQLSERFRLQFRAECFNVGNRPNFGSPNPNVDLPSVTGSVTSTTTTSRQFQFALKLYF